MTINERIRHLRKTLKLNQEDFSTQIGLKRASISWMEQNGNNITEQNTKQICSVFHVNENWLRNGDGDIFISDMESLIERLKDELHLNDTEIAILNTYLECPEEQRQAIINFALDMATKFAKIRQTQNKTLTAPTPAERAIAERVNAYDATHGNTATTIPYTPPQEETYPLSEEADKEK